MVNISVECGVATVVTVLLSTLAAYAFARMKFRGRRILFYSVLATMAFPAYTTLIPLYRIMTAFGLVNTYSGIILVYVSGFLPLATWIMYNYMSSLPISIEEAAQVDGASRMKVLWHVVLPLARPGIISTAVITFLFAWGQFLFPLVLSSDLSTQPLTVVIASLQGRHTVPFSLAQRGGGVRHGSTSPDRGHAEPVHRERAAHREREMRQALPSNDAAMTITTRSVGRRTGGGTGRRRLGDEGCRSERARPGCGLLPLAHPDERRS